jgi:5'(3')-deoxyribonucleotidase
MKKLFLDMDGTLAKFNSKKNALERFDKEKDFFTNLKPFVNIDTINQLVENNIVEIFIISASPNEQADIDKLKWINTYLPKVKKQNICFCRIGQNKAKIIKDKLNIEIDNNCYLLDDYTKNLIEWNNSKGIGIKRLTSLADNSRKLWKGLSIKNLNQLTTLFE